MPDYFVGEDTTLFSTYYSEAVSKGLITRFCFEYVDNNRETLQKFSTPSEIVRYLRRQNIVEQFIKYADNHDLRRRNNMILRSQRLFEHAIYGTIIYYILDMNDYMFYMNQDDATVKKAIEIFNLNKTKPVVKDAEYKKAAYEKGITKTHPTGEVKILA